MAPAIEFIFDFASPNAYFAHRALPPILARTGASLDVNPCLLGGIFKATNNKSPAESLASGTMGSLMDRPSARSTGVSSE